MSWNEWPGWLRGGVVAVTVYVVLITVLGLLAWLTGFEGEIPGRWTPATLLAAIHFPSVLVLLVFNQVKSWPTMQYMIVVEIIQLILVFWVGALTGWRWRHSAA